MHALIARPSAPAGVVRRARVILLSAAGVSGVDIAAQLALSPESVSRIRRRFAATGVDGLRDQPKAGRRDHAVPADTVDRIDPIDVARNAAAIAVMTYVIADMPARLAR